MPHSTVPKTKRKTEDGRRGRRLAVIILTALVVFSLRSQAALAYNYAGYRWGGSWPKPVVDYSGVAVNAWRVRIQNTMNDWNATGAKFTFQNGPSNNDITVYYDSGDNALMRTRTFRQYGFWGNIVKATVKINDYHPFNPADGYGYDFSTIMRHEYGHWLRLDHTFPPSLMQPEFYYGEIHYVDADARNGIRAIYGAQ